MWSDDPSIWQMAAEMCADDVCMWSTYDPKAKDWNGLTFALITNDYFVPGADAEPVEPAEVAELYEYWKRGEPMKWAEKKTGLKRWRQPSQVSGDER